MVLPTEGVGKELEGIALPASSANKPAKRFLDWTPSERAIREHEERTDIITTRGGRMRLSFGRASTS